MKYLLFSTLLVFVSTIVAKPPALPSGDSAKPPAGHTKDIKKKPDVKDKRPSRKPFPKHWGPPPRLQTRDLRPLPHGFGMGSSTLAKWILSNIKKDKEKGDGPKRPKRPEPSPEIKAQLEKLKDKRAAIHDAHKKLRSELKGKTKTEAAELIKAFRDTHKDKHAAIKEAHQELIKSIREKRQTGARRE